MTAGFFDLYQAPLITGGEKELLHAHLQISRDVLLWKLEGLSEADQRRPMTGRRAPLSAQPAPAPTSGSARSCLAVLSSCEMPIMLRRESWYRRS